MSRDEEQVAGAVFRVAAARRAHPELSRAETQSRLRLAAAIMAWDEGSAPAVAEQADVNDAGAAYLQSLADLVRGATSTHHSERRQ